MTTNDHSHGIDWDGELTALMESSGIDLAHLIPPSRTRRALRWLVGARAAAGALVCAMPLAWLVDASGAPAAARMPLVLWLVGWVGYGIWISAARPDLAAVLHRLGSLTTTTYLAGSRQVFERSRPARVRWRAWRTARARVATATV
ncbi:hypothetical protein ACFV4K_00330 [Nocardia sp. NPDC059764]|uniref:hypothetical protein n=1 Tax=Nocardia sp. NPDC059764 TaxID=3346939 RepID=UPI00364D96A9